LTASVSGSHNDCGLETAGTTFVTRDDTPTKIRGAAK
jgi:hypothetical protein